jgi:hypothetical protein
MYGIFTAHITPICAHHGVTGLPPDGLSRLPLRGQEILDARG